MNTHSPGKTEQQFMGWLPDVVGAVPGMNNIAYAGVTEVTKGNLLSAIYTNGHIRNANGSETQQFHVSVSNTGDLGSDEMLLQFKQSVTSRLADVISTNKSLPSA